MAASWVAALAPCGGWFPPPSLAAGMGGGRGSPSPRGMGSAVAFAMVGAIAVAAVVALAVARAVERAVAMVVAVASADAASPVATSWEASLVQRQGWFPTPSSAAGM